MIQVGVEIIGQNEIFEKLEAKFGQSAQRRIQRKALKAGADVMKEAFEGATATYMRTGATHEAVTQGSIRITRNGSSVKVGFGKHDPERYQLVHLNELGFSAHGVFHGQNNASSGGLAFYKPRGFHKLQDAWDENKDKALQAQQAIIKAALGL